MDSDVARAVLALWEACGEECPYCGAYVPGEVHDDDCTMERVLESARAQIEFDED